MNTKLTVLTAVAALLTAGAAAPVIAQSAPEAAPQRASAQTAPARTQGDFFAGTEWDVDAEDQRRYGRMPRPNVQALRAIGMVRATEVERDDGRLEVEGVDRHGRDIDAKMDLAGRRVISYEVDND